MPKLNVIVYNISKDTSYKVTSSPKLGKIDVVKPKSSAMDSVDTDELKISVADAKSPENVFKSFEYNFGGKGDSTVIVVLNTSNNSSQVKTVTLNKLIDETQYDPNTETETETETETKSNSLTFNGVFIVVVLLLAGFVIMSLIKTFNTNAAAATATTRV